VFGEQPGNSQNQNRILRVFQENSYHLAIQRGTKGDVRPSTHSERVLDQSLTSRGMAGLCFSHIRLQSLSVQVTFFDDKSDVSILPEP